VTRHLAPVPGLAVALVVVVSLAAPGSATAATATAPAGRGPGPDEGRIVAALPDPVADGDRGEFVVVRVPADGGNWTLTDGEDAVGLPPGLIAVSPDPAAVESSADRVVAADTALANAGERLVLRRNGRPVDALRYSDAPEGERLVVTPEGAVWRPRGFEPRSPETHGPAAATAFVLPDAPGPVIDALRGADRRLLVAGYTFTSERVAEALRAAARRGVEVRVLVEGGPVGGLSGREAALLDRLVDAGVAVRVVAGPHAPFRYHHAKYAVADDRALVLTENWKPAGVGGRGSRGWGVRVEGSVVGGLADLFRTDFEGPGAVPWRRFREGRTFVTDDAAGGDYPARFEPERVRADRIRLLTAPGNAREALVARVDAADERVLVLQPTVGGRDDPLVRASLRAARRGVEVRILLSGAWYVDDENRRLVERLNGLAEREDLALSAAVADPGGRYGKLHAKGLVVDDAVAVGSLNWNDVSATENREVVLVLEGEPAGYFAAVFEADWRGGRTRLPPVLALGVAGAVGVALLVGRRELRFA